MPRSAVIDLPTNFDALVVDLPTGFGFRHVGTRFQLVRNDAWSQTKPIRNNVTDGVSVPIGPKTIAPSHDQPADPIGDRDLRLGPRIELQAVGFDAVAEDDAVFRHERADAEPWSATHAYFALMPDLPASGPGAADARWFAVGSGKPRVRLAFDHADILEAAVQRLRSKVEYTSLPAYLMPPEFTLPDLQRVYEIVLDRPLEKSAFRTRMLAADLIEPVAKMRKGPNRPAQLYRLKKARSPVFFARTFNAPG
nr:DNA mismatch repair protein MutT [Bradyrhizobium sp. AUGA SZCCT0222]